MEEVKILDIFNFPTKKLVAIVASEVELSIGDYLIDSNDIIAWEIEGVVLHVSKDAQSKPVVYLESESEPISISLIPMDHNSNIEKGEIYYLKRGNLRRL